ncbi:TIGR03435 family protein [Silvibacterium sp.]|uniref:TIGR03435 family protein n=1 Tax=Silvibacterium sp. TaxID=1964179 RepID=UPI0039E5ACBE
MPGAYGKRSVMEHLPQRVCGRCALLWCLVSLMPAVALPANAQSQTSPQVPTAFDVISIHPHAPGSSGMSISRRDGNFDGENVDLDNLLMNAYGIRPELILGKPSWADSRHWDIHAKIVDPPPDELKKLNLTREQEQQLIASLLADRFHVKTHWETRQLPIYDLVVDKNGPKFAQNAAANAEDLKSVGGGGMMSRFDGTRHLLVCGQVPLSSLTFNLSGELQRDVIDQTGLTGKYSFALKYSSQDAPQGADDAGPSIFAALQEQLGLKLVSAKGPVKTLVIDHIEEPTEN